MRLVRGSVITLVVTFAAFVAVAPRRVLRHRRRHRPRWANGVCSSVQTWLDSVNSTVKGLKGAGSLDRGHHPGEDGREDGDRLVDVEH